MARDWSDLFITGEATRSGEPEPARAEKRRGLFRRLRENLSKTRQALGGELQATLWGTLDEHTWERLEEALIMADVGASTTASVVARWRRRRAPATLTGGEALSERLVALLAETARVGDAGSTCEKPDGDPGGRRERHGQDHDDRQAGPAPAGERAQTVLLGAADTFRAAASEQLEVWAHRAGARSSTGPAGRTRARSPSTRSPGPRAPPRMS